jgi:flavin-dependent dehydrogenase
VVRDRIALVGDASGSLDPITGEGLSIAFAQARAFVRSLEHGHLAEYAVAHRRISRVPRILTGLLLVIERHPRLRRRMVLTFATRPSLFADLVDVAASGGASSILPDFKSLRPAARITRSGP